MRFHEIFRRFSEPRMAGVRSIADVISASGTRSVNGLKTFCRNPPPRSVMRLDRTFPLGVGEHEVRSTHATRRSPRAPRARGGCCRVPRWLHSRAARGRADRLAHRFAGAARVDLRDPQRDRPSARRRDARVWSERQRHPRRASRPPMTPPLRDGRRAPPLHARSRGRGGDDDARTRSAGHHLRRPRRQDPEALEQVVHRLVRRSRPRRLCARPRGGKGVGLVQDRPRQRAGLGAHVPRRARRLRRRRARRAGPSARQRRGRRPLLLPGDRGGVWSRRDRPPSSSGRGGAQADPRRLGRPCNREARRPALGARDR